MENWEQKLDHVETPEGSVTSHREALRSKLKHVKPRSPRRAPVLTLGLVLLVGLTGLTVAYPGWAEDIFRVVVKEIRLQTEDGKQIQIRTIEGEGLSDSVCSEMLVRKDGPADFTKTLSPGDPLYALVAEGAFKKIVEVNAQASGEAVAGQHEQQLVIKSLDGGSTWIVNGDTVESIETIKALQSQCDMVKTAFDGEAEAHSSTTGTAEGIAPTFELFQNYPNPFNLETQIAFDLSEAGEVKLKVYDLTGREVAALVEGYQSAGTHTVTFDGSGLASGTYLCKLDAHGFQLSRSMTLLK